MATKSSDADRDLDRKGYRLRASSRPFLLLGGILGLVGVVVILVGASIVVGAVLIGLALAPLGVAIALMLPGVVAWWAARQKPFA